MPPKAKSQSKLPPRIGKGVKVKTKTRPPRHGEVIEAIAKQKWKVKFDDDGTTEERTSSQLTIYTEYYNVKPSTPKSALKTIRKAVNRTIGRRRQKQNGNDTSEEIVQISSNDGSSNDNDSSSSSESGYQSNESTSSPLLTPRTLSPSMSSRRLFSNDETSHNSESNDSEEDSGESEDASFDDEEEDEEDENGKGTKTIIVDDDGGEQVDFFDEPQKDHLYKQAVKIMKEDKKNLIKSNHEIIKTVKPQNKYDIGGKVEGRARTIKAGEKGTIIDVCDDDVFLVEWDNEDLPDCRVEKKHLKLEKGLIKEYTWRVVQDHIAQNPPTSYERHGMIGFKTSDFNAQPNDDQYNHPFFKLVHFLWPGDWRKQLSKLNDAIRSDNAIPECTEDEWWNFWGIMIFAGSVGVGSADKLFDKGKHKIIKELPSIDLSERMKKYRFQQLKKLIPAAFHGDDSTDPWNPVRALINGFNNNRARNVAASFCKVHDESMSSWRARTSKLGGLPFLSFILRKPKPLGTEFKDTACSETGKSYCVAMASYHFL